MVIGDAILAANDMGGFSNLIVRTRSACSYKAKYPKLVALPQKKKEFPEIVMVGVSLGKDSTSSVMLAGVWTAVLYGI